MEQLIVDRVKELIVDYLAEHDIELVEMTYKRMQEGMTLRLLVDTPAGIRMDECEALNNFLSETLDRESVIEEHYLIEVSSPGLDRPMKTDRDFERNLGKEIEVTTYEPVDGRKTHDGRFIGMNRDEVVIEKGGVSAVIPRAKIALARLKLEF